MKPYNEVEEVGFEGDDLRIKVNGQSYKFHLADISARLLNASSVERSRFEISPSGYGIHWPLLDEDLSIDGLLGISHSPAISKGKAA